MHTHFLACRHWLETRTSVGATFPGPQCKCAWNASSGWVLFFFFVTLTGFTVSCINTHAQRAKTLGQHTLAHTHTRPLGGQNALWMWNWCPFPLFLEPLPAAPHPASVLVLAALPFCSCGTVFYAQPFRGVPFWGLRLGPFFGGEYTERKRCSLNKNYQKFRTAGIKLFALFLGGKV